MFLRTLPDGSLCRAVGWDRLDPGYEPLAVPGAVDITALAPCPARDPVEAAVREFWDTVVLPRPQPQIRPGRAITGKDAFLEVGGPRTGTYTVPNPLGGPDIVVTATATYTVDWGDGTVVTTTSQGGPWPDGDLTHVWTRAGPYDVVVTEQWAATWSAGPVSGALDGLQTVGLLDDFPVQEVQAVRTR